MASATERTMTNTATTAPPDRKALAKLCAQIAYGPGVDWNLLGSDLKGAAHRNADAILALLSGAATPAPTAALTEEGGADNGR